MKAEIKKLWVDELKSGEYAQTKHALHRPHDESFCCLGVLCEIAYRQGVVKQKVKDGGVVAYDDEVGTLPKSVRLWAGMKSDNGKLPTGAKYLSLASANDHGATFREIATIIDQHAEVL